MSEIKGKGPTALMKIILIAAVVFGLGYLGYKKGWFPSKPTQDTQVPRLDVNNQAVPGTRQIRLAHWTWNAHQAWALANRGKTTGRESLFAQNGISVQFMRIEEIPNQIAALKAFAKGVDNGDDNTMEGVHFFTIMGDAAGMVLNETNKALRDVDSDFRAEIIGFNGFSAGEDKFMGPPEWKQNPKTSLGGLVAGVAADGDWNVMIFWCAQNQIPFNSDTKYYDPNALNFLPTDSFIQAGEVYNANRPVERIFKESGRDYQGNPVKAGDKGLVAVNGVVTWTPVDKNIAEHRGGIVSIVSTKEYSNQMPCYIVGLKQWDERHKTEIKAMLTAIFTASDMINQSDAGLRAGRISPKSPQDMRWQAAQYSYEIFNSESPDFWYRYYSVFPLRDAKGLTVDVGGSAVSNLKRNILFFGLDGGTNIGEVVYNRFSKLAKAYYPDLVDQINDWNTVFNPVYLQELAREQPALASTDPFLPTFGTTTVVASNQIGELTYRFNFESGRASFMPGAETSLREALEQLAIAGNTKIEIHGHTDSAGDPDMNMKLSQQRAQAVFGWLRDHSGSSFPVNRVRVIPHGQNDLLAQDFQNGQFIEENAAKNRRVVVRVFKQ